jgi:glutamate-ammonia-ligase adenylyltransferase
MIGLGKFGGRELNYGADLDVIFVGNDARTAQDLIAAASQPSAEGTIASLDARLRPDGEKGALVAPLAAFEAYYRERAQLWEIQALTRARAITGPFGEQYIALARQVWSDAGRQRDLFAKIDNMLERIQRERSSGSEFLDFKTGVGGMVEAEFLVQALQMRSGIWEPNWEAALNLLRVNGVLSHSDAKRAAVSYARLRRIETALRRWENKNVSALPSEIEEQQKLARRLGYDKFEVLVEDYHQARQTIHLLYRQYVKACV